MIIDYRFKSALVAAGLLLTSSQAFSQNTTHSYDYDKIAPHPRILLDEVGEEKLRQSLTKVPEFKKVSDYIISTSNEIINEKPVFFKMSGKRLLAVSRVALTRLYYLSYAYRITENPKYLERVEKELLAICDFESWNPSHFLDTGEMAMGVAIAYDWLYDVLSPETKEAVRKAMVEKAFKPSYDEKLAWFYERHSNWNSVCNAGLVYGALAMMEEMPDQCIPIIEKALVTNKLPMTVFGPDGNYPEGPGYWNYGASFQVMLIAALESALGSDKGLSDAPGFVESADYMLFASAPSGDYFNYYDCGREKEALSSLFYFANKKNDPSLVYQELECIRQGMYTKPVISDIERILPNTLIFGKDLDLQNLHTPSARMFVGHGLTPVALARTSWDGLSDKYLGIKGGCAADGHSHMDQGTFVYDIGNVRWASDFGLQSYGTLEGQGVDLWNMEQNSQRWEVFRYNNFNHNTLSINDQLHNIDGRSEILETYDSEKELGAKVDLTDVLNRNNELKYATRKAVIVDDEYLKIEDVIEANDKEVDLRWNMVSPSRAEIIDKNTIKLSQKGKSLLLKVESDTDFKLVIRKSDNPMKEVCPSTGKKYEAYNHLNNGTIMVGFDAKVPAEEKATFVVTMIEDREEIKLKKNILVLDAPDPSTASEGDKVSSDISPIGVDGEGYPFAMSMPDWIPYGRFTIPEMMNKSFSYIINSKRIEPTGIVNAGIDRSADGQLGVRGGENNGIEQNEGYIFGLDLSNIDPSVVFEFTKLSLTFFDSSESAVVVNRVGIAPMMTLTGNSPTTLVKITPELKTEMFDISDLKIKINGGQKYEEILSIFNTSGGNFRIESFEYKVSSNK